MDRNRHLNGKGRKARRINNDVLAKRDAVTRLCTYMSRLANVMTALGHELVMEMNSYRFEDRRRIDELVKGCREASAFGKELLAAVSNERTTDMELFDPLATKESQIAPRRIHDENGASLASNPIQSNPIQSNPILLPDFKRAAFKSSML